MLSFQGDHSGRKSGFTKLKSLSSDVFADRPHPCFEGILGREGRGEWGLYVAYILHNFKAWTKKSTTIHCLIILFDALQSSRYNFEKFIYYRMEICCGASTEWLFVH